MIRLLSEDSLLRLRRASACLPAQVGQLASERGCTQVGIIFKPTERNVPALTFLRSANLLPGDGTGDARVRGDFVA